MEVTIYELIGLLKNGKAPKKIKDKEYDMLFDTDEIFYLEYNYDSDELSYRLKNGAGIHFDYYIYNNKLDKKVIIMDEDFKIEDVEHFEIIRKINQIIDILKDRS